MNNASLKQSIAQVLADAGEPEPGKINLLPASGGCINRAMLVRTEPGQRYFLKHNAADCLAMFQAEAVALEALAKAGEFRVPLVLGSGCCGDQSFLLLEFLDLQPLDSRLQAEAGRALARMHRHTSNRHGWQQDNTIGSSPQYNAWSEHWPTFYLRQRLLPQLQRLTASGHGFDVEPAHLEAAVERLFIDCQPAPSLLHGDFWAGNVAACEGRPALFDPASYYGDRETDLAMSELFGGFSAGFYQAYQTEWPLDSGYRQRRSLYQLYHLLNHANLFGGHYLQQAERSLRALL